jgi:hypothetical protein
MNTDMDADELMTAWIEYETCAALLFPAANAAFQHSE